jgi:uncharacterized membrane protein
MWNVMGSWTFVFGFFANMILWTTINTLLISTVARGKAFDPYPYILLDLLLSMLAGVQAAALLLAAKRSDAIASEIAIHTERNTDDIKQLIEENTAPIAEVKRATDLWEEIHLHVSSSRGGRRRADPPLSPGDLPPTRPGGSDGDGSR